MRDRHDYELEKVGAWQDAIGFALACAVGLGVLVVASFAHAAAQQTDQSYVYTSGTGTNLVQIFNCLATPIGAGGDPTSVRGEACAVGDWSVAVDCRGAPGVTVGWFEPTDGDQTGQLKVYDVTSVVGSDDPDAGKGGTIATLAGAVGAGAVDPTTNFTQADPEPMSIDLTDATKGAAGNAYIEGADGLGESQRYMATPGGAGWIMGSLSVCTADACEGRGWIRCVKP